MNQLPSDPKGLREAVGASVARLLGTTGSREVVSRAMQVIAAEARVAGLRAAYELVSQAELSPHAASGSTIFLTQYIEGYEQAIAEVLRILKEEIDGTF